MDSIFTMQIPVEKLALGNVMHKQVAIWAGYLDEPKRDVDIRKKTYQFLDDLLELNDNNPILFPWGTLSRHVRWDGLKPGVVVNGRIVSISGHPCGPLHPNRDKA